MSILLQGRNIEHSYREGKIVTPVLKGVNLDIESSKMTAIVGKSGSGKSTLLHVLGTLDTPTHGQIIFQNKDITALSERQKAKFRNHHLGFIYQFHHLLDDFTVLENVMLPLMISHTEAKLTKSRAHHLLERVGLQDRLNYLPSELSGGERQRVAIARAMVHSPELILADEPTGNLDEGNAATVFNLFKELVQDEKTAVVMVTHDLSLASLCDEIFEMVGGVVMPQHKSHAQAQSHQGLNNSAESPVTSVSLNDAQDRGESANQLSVVSHLEGNGISPIDLSLLPEHTLGQAVSAPEEQLQVQSTNAQGEAVSNEAVRAQQIAELRSQQLQELRVLEEHEQKERECVNIEQASVSSRTELTESSSTDNLVNPRTSTLSDSTLMSSHANFHTLESGDETVIVLQQKDSNHALDLER